MRGSLVAAARTTSKPSVTLQRPAVVLLLGVLVVLALVTTSPIAFWLLYALAAVVVVSYAWTRAAANRITLRRQLQTKVVTVGDEVREEFELGNSGRLPLPLVEIDDHSEFPGYSASMALSLRGSSAQRWRVRGVARRRGLYRLGPADLTVGDPFGIFSTQLHDARQTEMVVYPPISIMHDIEIPAGAMVGMSRSSVRTHQITADAAGIREFQPGDPLKRIHWLSTARRGELLVKEFDLEPTASLWITIDLHEDVHAGYGDESTEEYAVKIASSLAYQLVRDNKSVGFAAMGRDTRYLIAPQKGLNQLWRILEVLAVVRAQSRVPFAEFLNASGPAFGRGVSLIAATPSANPEWVASLANLGQRSVFPLAVAIDASTFDALPSNAVLEGSAHASGVGFVAVGRGAEFTTIRPDASQWAEYQRTMRYPMAAGTP